MKYPERTFLEIRKTGKSFSIQWGDMLCGTDDEKQISDIFDAGGYHDKLIDVLDKYPGKKSFVMPWPNGGIIKANPKAIPEITAILKNFFDDISGITEIKKFKNKD